MKKSKYIVTLEFEVNSLDLCDVEVEAESKEEAIKIAENKVKNMEGTLDFYQSKFYESSLITGNMEVCVEKIGDAE